MAQAETPSASQTLLRGLDLIEAVSQGSGLDLAERVGLSRSTAHRLATALVQRGFLVARPRAGYRLGPKMLELGFAARNQIDLVQMARPHLEALSAATEDMVRLGVLQNERAVYIDVVPGRRRVTIAHRPGDSQPLTSTSVGKSLILDETETQWQARLAADVQRGRHPVDPDEWLARMRHFRTSGYTFGLGENDDDIRGVAAPVRDVSGQIAGAVSVTSAAQYMDEARMLALSVDVRAAAAAISAELGYVRP